MGRSDRPSSDDEPGVDFLVDAADDRAELDEDLPQPDDERSRARRLRVELGAGAVALLVALLIARALFGPDSTPQGAHRGAHPSATVPRAATPTGPVTAPPYLYKNNLPPQSSSAAASPHPAFPPSIPRRRGPQPTACPGLRCSTSAHLPTPVTDAIQAAFPESMIEQGETVRLRGGDRVLWFREVDVRVASQQLTLRVQAPAKGDRTGSGHRTVGGQRTTYVSTSLGPWHVEVEVRDVIGSDAPTSRLQSLAHDPRIVSL